MALVCYREKEKLTYILSDIQRQTAFDKIGEVLLFQNGNCKETRKAGEMFLDQLPLKIFSAPTNNLGLARAILVKKSLYDFIAWTDSDCSLPKAWLEELIRHWRNTKTDKLVAIGGPNRLPEKKFWQKMVNLSLSLPIGHGWSPQAWKVSHATKTYHIPTTNGLFLKSAILKAGNFSKHNKHFGEDLKLGFDLKKQGELILFPSPLVINHYANSYFESLKRLFMFGTIQSQRKSLLFYLVIPFAPLTFGFLILSLFNRLFLLVFASYFFTLFLFSFQVLFKNKKRISLLLPFFWFFQHFSYSLGTNFGLFKKN